MDRKLLTRGAATAALALLAFSAGCSSNTRPSAPGITGPSANLPDGTVGEAYSTTFTANGTPPIVWAVVSGSVPAGLRLNPDTGVMSGTPGAEADATFTVRARNLAGEATQQFMLTVEAAPVQGTPPTITTTTLPDATVGVAYQQTMTASGTTPLNWSLSSGVLPQGMALGATTGALAGTPTAAGQASVTIQATNSAGADTQALTLTVHAAPTAPSIQGPSSPLPNAALDAPYSQTFTATGTTPITWTISHGTLPTGLQLDSSTGELSGTPTAAGPATFTVTATNSAGTDDQACELTVAQPPSITTLTPDEAPIGTTIVLDGSGFDTTPGDNTVTFDAVTATVLSATANQLSVQVPAGISDVVSVRVTVDSLQSEPASFTVDPTTVWFVDAGATGNDDGTSWTDAFDDLQDALAAADGNDELWVVAGTYVPGTLRTDSFVMADGLEIYGGFAGTEGTRGDRDPTINVTILSGDVDSSSDYDGDTYHVLVCPGNNTVDGLRLSGGHADGSGDLESGRGAGILVRAGNVTISNVEFRDAQSLNGTGIAVTTGTVTVSDCLFQSIEAQNSGAGILLEGTATTPSTISRCVFYSLTASNGSGGMVSQPGSLWSDCVFVQSHSHDRGAGLYLQNDGSTTVRNSTFYGLNGDFDDEVGIYTAGDHDELTVTNCVLWDFYTVFAGADEIAAAAGSVTVTNCVITGGYASGVTGTKIDGGGNTDQDPQFISTGDMDGADDTFGTRDDGLMPGAAGSAVDAGTSTGASATDVTGTDRPQGATVDIGAYEADS